MSEATDKKQPPTEQAPAAAQDAAWHTTFCGVFRDMYASFRAKCSALANFIDGMDGGKGASA